VLRLSSILKNRNLEHTYIKVSTDVSRSADFPTLAIVGAKGRCKRRFLREGKNFPEYILGKKSLSEMDQQRME
jgi:hypothetical protein